MTRYSGYKPEMGKAINKYQKDKLELVSFRVKKGKREKYKELARKRGVSLKKLLEDYLDAEMEKEGIKTSCE